MLTSLEDYRFEFSRFRIRLRTQCIQFLSWSKQSNMLRRVRRFATWSNQSSHVNYVLQETTFGAGTNQVMV